MFPVLELLNIPLSLSYGLMIKGVCVVRGLRFKSLNCAYQLKKKKKKKERLIHITSELLLMDKVLLWCFIYLSICFSSGGLKKFLNSVIVLCCSEFVHGNAHRCSHEFITDVVIYCLLIGSRFQVFLLYLVLEMRSYLRNHLNLNGSLSNYLKKNDCI